MSTRENFLKDVAGHVMRVDLDSGTHRHLVFHNPKRGIHMRFEIITWPGYLAYVGDMGSFTFQRLPDMLDFFRSDDGGINPGYWSGKLEATNKRGGHTEYDGDALTEYVRGRFRSWMRNNYGTTDKEERRELWEAIKDEVLEYADDENRGPVALHDFCHRLDSGRFYEFQDIETDFVRPSYHYLWCCHALVWGIAQYDKFKAESAGGAA